MTCSVISSSVFPGWYYNYGQIWFIKRYRIRREITYDTLHEIDGCTTHHATVKYKKGISPIKKGSLPDSHYNIVLDK